MHLTRKICAGLVLAMTTVGQAVPALAWSSQHDRAYADSFGNLVIDSATGYKRILVGEGAMARKMADYTSAGQPRVLRLDRTESGYSEERDCYRPPAFVKGRSYMYGLADGEMPEISPCR
ncbi:MAG TPA: hypothetical protein VGV39_26160 [Mesorhizobium sp.]|uniref:hypothetical protein n=1 Tax=Mesorhizobium sp. TaxID=1871066 RepID=UPI002DDCACAF|nr:hypothetical protein [Mesorhizobium sp.]HEV2506585.1 hypothetical protein [Mesorhizobium sp.]